MKMKATDENEKRSHRYDIDMNTNIVNIRNVSV